MATVLADSRQIAHHSAKLRGIVDATVAFRAVQLTGQLVGLVS